MMYAFEVVLQITYFLVSFGVVCVGVFGISATKTERMLKAEQFVPTRKMLYDPSHPERVRQRYLKLTQEQLWWTLLCACVWPLGIPLYLAWKKGSFINDAMQKREELQHDLHRSG